MKTARSIKLQVAIILNIPNESFGPFRNSVLLGYFLKMNKLSGVQCNNQSVGQTLAARYLLIVVLVPKHAGMLP